MKFYYDVSQKTCHLHFAHEKNCLGVSLPNLRSMDRQFPCVNKYETEVYTESFSIFIKFPNFV